MAKKFSELRSKLPAERQARAKVRTAHLLAEMPLKELRQARKRSQESIAKRLGAKQATVSKMERRADMYVSTLRNFIEAMGGELDIVASFPEGDVRITQFEALGLTGKGKHMLSDHLHHHQRVARA